MYRALIAFLAATTAAACGGFDGSSAPSDVGAADRGLTGEQTSRLLRFVNSATFERLDVDCALRSDAARNIVSHRDGPDGVLGTADDNPFDSLAELDGVSRVGTATLTQLADCADATAILTFVNQASFEFLDVDCSLRADAARNIVAHRDGPDGVLGTSDDNPFDSLAELDAVPRVGEAALAAVAECAWANPVSTDPDPEPEPEPPPSGPSYEIIYDIGQIAPELAALIEGPLLAEAESYKDENVASAMEFHALTIHRYDGAVDFYYAEYAQMIDPARNLRMVVAIQLDSNYDIVEVYADVID